MGIFAGATAATVGVVAAEGAADAAMIAAASTAAETAAVMTTEVAVSGAAEAGLAASLDAGTAALTDAAATGVADSGVAALGEGGGFEAAAAEGGGGFGDALGVQVYDSASQVGPLMSEQGSWFGNAMASAAPYAKVASTAGSLISGVTGFMGAQQQSAAQQAAANYQASIARINAQIAQQNGQMSIEKGEFNATMAGKDTAAKVGGIMAQQAANGIDVNSGSAVDVRSSAAQMGQLNVLSIRDNASREARGYTNQAESYGLQAGMSDATATGAAAAGGINSATSLLGGATTAATNWAKWSSQ